MSACFVALACTLAQPSIAQEERGVPIVEAPYHLPVFRNEYVTLLKVFVPPGKTTGYHIHTGDSVSVNVEPADMTNQPLGAPAAGPAQRGEAGRATFTAYTKQGPRTHKATNVGATPFHTISVIFSSVQPYGFAPQVRDVPGYAQVMDNERARAWRLELEPGQSTLPITHSAPGIRIVVAGGELAESVPGRPDRAMSPRTGDFFWQDAGVTRAVRNTGRTRLELVEFELK
jgi:quercetin dioxygenase-like cupin family protein